MKKLFAILLVMALMVGFVFADDPVTATEETHKIQLKSVVAGVLPIFQLEYEAQTTSNPTDVVGEENLTRLENQTSKTNTSGDGESWKAGEEYTGATVEVADISQHDIEVVFKAILANSDKRIHARQYTITFTAGDFAVKKNKVDDTHSASSFVISNELQNSNYVTIADATTTVAHSDAMTVTFLGNTGTTANDVLAKFTAKYEKDNSIDPSGDDGYTADITMVIAAEY